VGRRQLGRCCRCCCDLPTVNISSPPGWGCQGQQEILHKKKIPGHPWLLEAAAWLTLATELPWGIR